MALSLVLSGRVQGVGFRPFVYRLAMAHNLSGWVRNRVGLVEIVVQGGSSALQAFTRNLFHQAPPLSAPQLESCLPAAVSALTGF